MNMRTIFREIHLTLAMAVLIGGWTAQDIRADNDSPGAVCTLSNAASGNALVVFQRDKNGGLSLAGTVDTGGLGTGSGLGSQGALALRGNQKNVLYAVNAGSNQISVFKSGKKGPKAVQLIDSAGLNPISVTTRENTLYVLNAGSSAGDVDQITGFRIDDDAHLRLLPNSTQGLSAGSVGPAQVGFNPDGKILVVTEKNTNKIDTFVVDRHGYAGGMLVQPSSGVEPFGFAFNKDGYLMPSEAFGGAPNASAVSSYAVDTRTGTLQLVSASVSTLQTAACWISVTRNGRYVYSSNTGSGNVTGYSIDRIGALTLLDAGGVSGVTGGAAVDSAIVENRFLYVLTHDATESRIYGFEIAHDGSLEPLGSVGGLPTSTVGLVAE
jgi:6-phosphogluconolactonase (cycloisomerase 2 family)